MKHKNTHKFLSLLTVCAMLFSLLCTTAFAVEETISSTENAVAVYNGEGYPDLSTAIEDAELDGGTVTLVSNYILESDLTVPDGVILEIASDVMLTIPTSATGNDTLTGNNVSGAVVNGSAYRTLTVSSGASVVVNGTLLVAGNQQSTQPKTGCLTGNFGKIDLSGTLTVENGGKLYARGEISGSGSVTAKNGSTVYQLFQIMDWRGGTKARDAYNNNVFPFSLYEIKNITATTTYYNGSKLEGQYYIVAGGSGVPGSEIVIGTNGQMEFDAAPSTEEAAAHNVEFKYDNNKNATVTVNGAMKTGSITVTMSVYGFPYTISSTGIDCPFGYKMDVVIADGGSLSISNQMKFLPGCEVTVENGGELTIEQGGKAYFYTGDEYLASYNFNGSQTGWTSTEDAVLSVSANALTNNGTIASSKSDLTNLPNYFTTVLNEEGAATTVTVNEYVQATGVAPVTFTVGTPAAPSVEE